MSIENRTFDVIVIGAGHAGCEAAHASAKMGSKTALLTMNPDRIGFMSCNPAMGGLAKGQLIKEIDALGGIMGMQTDRAAIQYRRLNSSKGPAVRSSRAQCDKALYSAQMSHFLANVEGLSILPLEASEILTEGGRVCGVLCADGTQLRSDAVVITTGTFLRAIMHTGFEQNEGGRVGDKASNRLSDNIKDLGLALRRLKTGTPPRLDRNSIDFSKTIEQPGDIEPVPFSFYFRPTKFPILPQVSCFITHTNTQTHDIIEKNFKNSPLFTGIIEGIGPRYCPSIEDKVKRFRERDRHQIFLEPEGLTTDEIYVNGISTSLPREVQDEFVHSINGLESARFTRYGYAVEYDAIDATQLKNTLEFKDLSGLFFAGQINGTSGYEEAGAQGLIAGINAARSVSNDAPFSLARHHGYVGVLIDDLITKGTDEPYRMFTSRAEYRLLLREDNADIRLTPFGRALGLIDDKMQAHFEEKLRQIEAGHQRLREHFIFPTPDTNNWFEKRGLSTLKDKVSADVLMRRPEIGWNELADFGLNSSDFDHLAREQVEIQVKYKGYIDRDLEMLEGVRRNEDFRIPRDFPYARVSGLSTEIRDRLVKSRPETIGQASRMMGVTPAAVANLLIYLKTHSSATQ